MFFVFLLIQQQRDTLKNRSSQPFELRFCGKIVENIKRLSQVCKLLFQIAIAVAVIITDTAEAQASGGISWCEYARLVGRNMAGCSNGKVGGTTPPLNTMSSDPGKIIACNAFR